MLFPDGLFAPQTAADVRVQAALGLTAGLDRDLLGPVDLLAGVVRCDDPGVTAAIKSGLPPTASWPEALSTAGIGHASQHRPSAPVRTRDSFSPAALAALDEFESALAESQGALERVALEVLAVHILVRLEVADQQLLAPLDVHQAVAHLIKRVLGGFDFRSIMKKCLGSLAEVEFKEVQEEDSPDESPDDTSAGFKLLADLVPVEDLTGLAVEAAGPGPFPFDQEPQFDKLFEEMTRALHRRGRHLLLVGERGVCKDTIVADLARRAAAAVILSLGNREFLRVDCRRFPPDDCPQRLAELLGRVASHHELVIVLNGLPSLLRGQHGEATRAVLLAALDRLRCHLVVPLTSHEYQELFSDEPDLAECCTRIEVEEPEPEVALKVLRRFAAGLAHEFVVLIDDEAIRQAVLLSHNFILNDQLPAKALKVLHQACEDLAYEREHQGNSRQQVTAEDVLRVVAKKSGVPEETLRGTGEGSDFEQGLREFILGQDHAVHEVATELGLIKAGMTDPGKPASVMLFLGQTGTGKTEMAKALARLYSTSGRLRTCTLGNCVEPHSVSTIIGVPPGYVGHDKGGPLVNDLNADPYCVFLLDEADKAHPDVLQPFLNLFDEGWVVDQRGVKAYGDRAIFILTTNVGQRMMAEMVEQKKTPEQIRDQMRETLAHIKHPKAERPVFSAEFLARIKRIIVFNPLGQEALEGITRKLFRELEESWSTKRSRSLEVPEELVRFVAARAHELNDKSKGKEGGRIVRKLIADWVEAPLQRAISARPREYRECALVALDFIPPEAVPAGGPAPPPTVSVRFGVRCAA